MRASQRSTSTARASLARAFTLVELLIIIIVISILITVTLVVATRVTNTGRDNLSKDTIRVLDTFVQSTMQTTGSRLPDLLKFNPQNSSNQWTFPIVDGRYDDRPGKTFRPDTDPAQPSLSLFLAAASLQTDVESILNQIGDDFVKREPVRAWGWDNNSFGALTIDPDDAPMGMFVGTVLDGHEQPLRFVHPSYDGGHGDYSWWEASSERWQASGSPGRPTRPPLDATWVTGGTSPVRFAEQFSRSMRPYDANRNDADQLVGDADEGICPGDVPYFYSAGADQDPGTREDNAYSTDPNFPIETEDQS